MQKFTIPLSKQLAVIRSRMPGWKANLRLNKLILQGNLQPTPNSEVYSIRIEYQDRGKPMIYVVSPSLKCREDSKEIPHTYTPNRLCLYYPKYGEWKPSDLLYDTIIPWTSLWLY